MILECINCEAIVQSVVLHSYEDHNPKEPPCIWTFAQCPKCNYPMLAVQEDYGDGWTEPYRIYPAQEKQLGRSVPAPIRVAHAEARRCLKVKAYTASAIMCRKTLEAVCAAHQIKQTVLARSLRELKDKGFIEERLFQWAEALRDVGNEAAHAVEVSITAQDANDLLQFTEALIEYIFTYRDKFEQFKLRMKMTSNKGSNRTGDPQGSTSAGQS